MFSRVARALCLVSVLLATACSRRPQAIERFAVLRFENLTPDPATDWMGRAFAEVIAADLSGAPDLYAIPSARLHGFNRALGPRPVAAPGISAEAAFALAAGANRIAYGEYAVAGGRLRARVTIEDVENRRVAREPIEAAVDASDVLGAANTLAARISPHAQPYGTRSEAALEAYARCVESTDAAAVSRYAGQAIAADPDFAGGYAMLSELKTKQQDRAGALGVLDAALGRGRAVPERDRIRLEILAAALRGDSAEEARALDALVAAAPLDPAGWRALAEAAGRRHEFPKAAQAYQRAAAIEPQDGVLWNQLGYMAAYAGNLELSMSALRRYQALRPSDPNPLDSMGDINLLAGRPREAERFYLEALKMDPAFLGGIDLYKAATARLMTGDTGGAEAIAKQGGGGFESRAEWLWATGRRREAYTKLAAEAPALADRDARARAYAELAIWALFLDDRESAARLAQQAAGLASAASAAPIAVARFVALPPASPSEWAARAGQFFPKAPPNSIKDMALAYALLLNRQFEAALPVLRQLEAAAPPNGDRATAIELAWALIETGRVSDAAPLLRLSPVPLNPTNPFLGFYFPRLYQLRATLAEKEGKADEARENRRIYAALGGK